MGLGLWFGMGEKDIVKQNNVATGEVTAVKTWYFIKVNRKAIRFGPLDGATFPHRILFTYEVHGNTHMGSRVLKSSVTPPKVGDKVRVFYDGVNPERYAIKL